MLWQEHERRQLHTQNRQRHLSLLRGAYDGVDGKTPLSTVLEDHVCTDCTLPFCYSFVFVPMQKLDLRRCCTYTAMQERAIFAATADLQQEVG